VILFGMLAGLAVALLGLASVSSPPRGCDYRDAGRLPGIVCLTIAEGAPLRWLTAYHGTPLVNWAAMARDWAQDAVISVAALYGFWTATRAREEPAGSRALAAAIAGTCALGPDAHRSHRRDPSDLAQRQRVRSGLWRVGAPSRHGTVDRDWAMRVPCRASAAAVAHPPAPRTQPPRLRSMLSGGRGPAHVEVRGKSGTEAAGGRACQREGPWLE
jgi:hypothetical protein